MHRVVPTTVVLAVISSVAVATVSARTGAATGTGRVFFPNPVQQLGDESLTDQKDADYAALQPAYRTVTLTNLDGSGTLTGDWARVISETGKPARSKSNTFVYNRHEDQFEQVMAYYWVTAGAEVHPAARLRDTLFRRVNKESQDIRDQPVRRRQLVLDEASARTSSGSARAASTTPRTPR